MASPWIFGSRTCTSNVTASRNSSMFSDGLSLNFALLPSPHPLGRRMPSTWPWMVALRPITSLVLTLLLLPWLSESSALKASLSLSIMPIRSMMVAVSSTRSALTFCWNTSHSALRVVLSCCIAPKLEAICCMNPRSSLLETASGSACATCFAAN